MPHFFVPPEHIEGGTFILTGPEARHLFTVRRCRPGSVIGLFDGTGKTYVGTVTAASPQEIKGAVVEQACAAPPRAAIRLYNAVPRGDRFDWLVEKAAELGVAELTPLVTERSAVRHVPPAKVERWNRLSRAASQQSRRNDIMRVNDPLPLSAAVAQVVPPTAGIIAWEGEDTRTLHEAVGDASAGPIAMFVGPEGGFAAGEIECASAAGIVPVTLGSNILRVETAGLLTTILVLNAAGRFA